jgi:hypothetical protein
MLFFSCVSVAGFLSSLIFWFVIVLTTGGRTRISADPAKPLLRNVDRASVPGTLLDDSKFNTFGHDEEHCQAGNWPMKKGP